MKKQTSHHSIAEKLNIYTSLHLYKILFSLLITYTLFSLAGCSYSTIYTASPIEIDTIPFNLPTGVVTDSEENLYILDSGTHQVLKFNKNGNFLLAWGGEGSADGQILCYEEKGTICGLAIDSQDNIYVVDKGNYRIQKFDSTGNFLLAWGSQGIEDGQFIRPIYAAVGPQGNIFVSDDVNPVIQKFDGSGQFLLKWGELGKGNGQFRHATGIAVDSLGNVYISDYENRIIQKFDSNGEFLASWKTGSSRNNGTPEAIAIDDQDRIYVTDSKLKQIIIFDSSGETLTTIPLDSVGFFNRISPYGIAIDRTGDIYVTDRDNNRVLKYSQPDW